MTSIRLFLRASLIVAAAAAASRASEPDDAGHDEAFARLAAYEFGASRETTDSVHDLVLASLGDPERRRGVASRLASIAASPGATLDAKRFACRELALVGGAEDTAVLSALLFDADLRDDARFALEAIPDPAAARALRNALPRLEGAGLVGAIDSLGTLRDRDAVEALAHLVGPASKGVEVAAAAVRALGKIGDETAAGVLGAVLYAEPTSAFPRAADAALACAESLVRSGRSEYAIPLCDMLRSSGRSLPVRMAALRALLVAGDPRAPGFVLDSLASADAEEAAFACRLVREAPGAGATRAFADAVARVPQGARASLLAALGERGDPAAEAAARGALASEAPDVRLAALAALGRIGGESSVLPLAAAASSAPSREERAAARASLERLPGGPSADAAIARALSRERGEKDLGLRLEAIRALGVRRAATATEALVLALEATTDDTERAALETALVSVSARAEDRDAAAAPLVAALGRGTTATRSSALRVLGTIGGTKALAALREALKTGDATERDAAAQGLSMCPDPEVRPDLLAMALEPERNAVAIAGLVRLATGTPAERLAILERALALARGADAKRLVIAALATVPDPAAWRLVEPLRGDAEFAPSVRAAGSGIAEAIAESHRDVAAEIATSYIRGESEASARAPFERTLDRIERLDDYVRDWLVSGPHDVKGQDASALFDVAFPPEGSADGATWRRVGTNSGAGRPFEVDLSAEIGGEQRAAYLRTEVRAPRDMDARLEIGSDDGVKAWLNGELVHGNPAFRGLSPGEDRIDVRLREGWNELLLKVVQGGGGWAACARLRDRSGRRIDGLATRVPDAEPGFTPLFDGESLRGWVIAGREAGWAVEDGTIVSRGGLRGGYLRTPRPYRDFVLRLEWKVSKNGNSGVFVRASDAGDPWVTGHEIQITNEPRGDLHCTGSLYGSVAASPRPDEAEDVWHRYEIVCDGPRITVRCDGITTVDADQDEHPSIAEKPLSGYIGLQDSHTGPGGLVAFRNVRVKELHAAPAAGGESPRVLVFSKTAGFRHGSIPDGIAAIRAMGDAKGFLVDATEDAAAFTVANLRRYVAVVFLNTTGDVLDAAQESAFERYVRRGGGFVGVHSAADTEYEWPFYRELVGALFMGHPAVQSATIRVEDRAHLSTAHLGATWVRTDEWYDYRTNPRGAVRVLLSLDESTYTGGQMGGDHPIAWCRPVGDGRAWYTGGGHTSESYREPAFLRHLLGGIRYAAR